MAAASPRFAAPSFVRMCETWTPAGPDADEELARDLAVRPAEDEPREHLALAGGEAERRRRAVGARRGRLRRRAVREVDPRPARERLELGPQAGRAQGEGGRVRGAERLR